MGKLIFLVLVAISVGIGVTWGWFNAFICIFILFFTIIIIGYEFRFKAGAMMIRSVRNSRLDEAWSIPLTHVLTKKRFVNLPENFIDFYTTAVKPELNVFDKEIAAIAAMTNRAEAISYVLELRRTVVNERELMGLITASGAYHGTEIPIRFLDYNEFAKHTYIHVFMGGGWIELSEYVRHCKRWEESIASYYDETNATSVRGLSKREYTYSLKEVCDRAGKYISGDGNPSARPVPFPQFAWEMRDEDKCIFKGFANRDEITIEDYKTSMTIVFLEALGYVPLSYLTFSRPARVAANAIFARYEKKDPSTLS